MPRILDWWGKVVTTPEQQRFYTFTQIGKGWHPLLKEIFDFLPEDTCVLQVKEKFGELRVYTSAHHEGLQTLLNKSRTICELCGDAGTQRRINSWVHTVCSVCAEKIEKEGFRRQLIEE